MIPKRLTLKCFLSYREATLDFEGLHTACICGPNGAGKSSLLEAIAWALWGESRAAVEDDVIYMGAKEAQVDFVFEAQGQVYRVIRTRYRGQHSALEFQAQTLEGFRSLTRRGLRATQQLILDCLKLDYETFVNSAYLRQGRADEFMLKRPSERKQILADLLKLGQYDELGDRAKDLARQYKGQIQLLEQSWAQLQEQLALGEAIAADQAQRQADLEQLQQAQDADQAQLQAWQAQQQQRRSWQQELTWHQQQHQQLLQDVQVLLQEIAAAQGQKEALEVVLAQSEAIAAQYADFQALQAQEARQSEKFRQYQQLQHEIQDLQQLIAREASDRQAELGRLETQLEALRQQDLEAQQVLSKQGEVEAALAQLTQARQSLADLDQLQMKVAPLAQRRLPLQAQLDRAAARLSARWEELQASAQQLQAQQSQQPALENALVDLTGKLEYLERRRIYRQRVQEKGLERRSFMDRLQAHQRDYETQLAELEQKMQLLGEPDALCPLCDRPLDEQHWALVQQKHQATQGELQDLLWVVRQQLAVSEREIQVLRQEYRDLGRELDQEGLVRERRGQLQQQLQATLEAQRSLAQVQTEMASIERSLQVQDYAPQLSEELRLLDETLAQLSYDEKTHALARGQVDRWRWAEIKQAEIRQAQQRRQQLAEREPQLQAQLVALQEAIAQSQRPDGSPRQQQMTALRQQLANLDYDPDQHNALRQTLRDNQMWQLRYQELQQAQQQHPELLQRCEGLAERLAARQQDAETVAQQIAQLTTQLTTSPDHAPAIAQIEQQMHQRRADLDRCLADLGRLQQQQQQLAWMAQQSDEQRRQIVALHHRHRVYRELAQAFGKNGIQALMIENVLPQLEVETNQILARLSANQLHVQFVTQRAGRRAAKSRSRVTKLIDTLDILIADTRGTRPFETYSGGEAFRISFAIRLALARLLAQRSGTALRMLIIDEGFGTQDQEGCDRLIAAINAIAPDFACILTITHMPRFKEAFQSRIEVGKTELGSHLSLHI